MSDEIIKTGPRDYRCPIGGDPQYFIKDSRKMKPISIIIPAEHFQRNRPNSTSIAEDLANAIRMHDGFRGHSIVFEIKPALAGELPDGSGVIYVRT